MKTITTKYVLMGCLGKDCVYHRGETEEKEIVRGRVRTPTYISVTITPHCSKTGELSEMRRQIYAEADAAKDSVFVRMEKREISPQYAHKKAHQEWLRISDKWRQFRCPYFSPSRI